MRQPRYLVRVRSSSGKVTNKTFATRRMAEQFEREQLHARDRGAMIDPNAGRITVAAWAAEWLAQARIVVRQRSASTKRIFGCTFSATRTVKS
jgi:hypothetical protein